MSEDKNNINRSDPDKSGKIPSLSDLDPLDAYFKHRVNRASTSSNGSSIFRYTKSDRSSSLGLLDLNNFSIHDDLERLSLSSLKDTDSLDKINERIQNLKLENSTETKHVPLVSQPTSNPGPSPSELQLMKQRELAKKTLMQFNEQLESIGKNLKSLNLDINEAHIKQPKLLQNKGGISQFLFKESTNNWLDENQSPQTPKNFMDELNSINESSTEKSGAFNNACRAKLFDTKDNENDIKMNNPAPPVTLNQESHMRDSILIFQSQNPDEILSRFEEDEKKFMKEQSAVSNNSQISNFSGVMGETFPLSLPESVAGKGNADIDGRMSIGKYFELRSHSLNSIVGPENLRDSLSIGSATETLLFSGVLSAPKNEKESTTPMDEKSYVKRNELSKHVYSSFDDAKNKSPDSDSLKRNSTESSISTSTLLIQDLLCRMDSGLSGTQINDRLLECLSKMKNEKRGNNEESSFPRVVDNSKTSKTNERPFNRMNSSKDKSEGVHVSTPLGVNKVARGTDEKKPPFTPLTDISSIEFKENIPEHPQTPTRNKKSMVALKNENVGNFRSKGFDCSTPKPENLLSEAHKFTMACDKIRLKNKDWESPRTVSSKERINVTGSYISEENDKTLVPLSFNLGNTVGSSTPIIQKGTALNMRESIISGDLSILSEKIKETTIRPSSGEEEDAILAVVDELVNYSTGSLDCSALIPLLRRNFPELLSGSMMEDFENDVTQYVPDLKVRMTDEIVPPPGSWVNMPLKCGYQEDVNVPVEVKKLISIPVRNLGKDWLIVSLSSVSIQYQSQKCLSGNKIDSEFCVGDFLAVHMKDTLISPDEMSYLKVRVTPKVPTTLNIRLSLCIKKLMSKESQMQDVIIRVLCTFPKDNICINPKNEVNFGLVPFNTTVEKMIEVVFDGICDLPLTFSVDKTFISIGDVMCDNEKIHRVSGDKVVQHIFKEGEKQVLLIKLLFTPRFEIENKKDTQIELKGKFSVAIETPKDHCALHEIPVKGSVALGSFYCVPNDSPLVFRSTEIGHAVKRELLIRNTGSLEIEVSLSVTGEPGSRSDLTDTLFLVSKSTVIPRREERFVDIVFTGKTKENYVRRYLVVQMKTNPQMRSQIELIGVVMPARGRSVSRASSHSGPTTSVYNPGNIPFKLKTTSQCISWASVPLDLESKQTFHIMNASGCNAMARFSFKEENSSFRFVNENGEVIEKLRKVLKPTCSNVMTVVFRPDSAGPHVNSIIIETNHLSGKKMIALNGYGGCPKIFIRNLKSDLNGSKIIRLINSEPENQIFHTTLEFINKGNVAGFVSIRTVLKVISLSSGLNTEPSDFVIQPNARTQVTFSQKLKNEDIKRLLSGRDIGKLATVTVTTGDEPSRYRLRKLVDKQGIRASESIAHLLNEFVGEEQQNVDRFNDDKLFDNVFRKNVDTTEITAVIERRTDVFEPTLLEDFEETVKEFVTLLPASDRSDHSSRESDKPSSPWKLQLEKSTLSASSAGSSESPGKKITKWLASIEKP